jgi:hypothetical protein
LLSEKQSDWASDAIRHERGAVLFLPLNMKEIIQKLRDLSLSGLAQPDSNVAKHSS